MEQCTHRQLRGEKNSRNLIKHTSVVIATQLEKPHDLQFKTIQIERGRLELLAWENCKVFSSSLSIDVGRVCPLCVCELNEVSATTLWNQKLFSLTPLSSAPNQRAPCFVPLPTSRTRTFRNRLRTELKAARLVCQSPVAGQSSFTGSLESRFSIDVCQDDVQIGTSRRAASDNQHQRGSLHNKRSAFESWLQFTDCFYNPLNRNLKSGTGVRRP